MLQVKPDRPAKGVHLWTSQSFFVLLSILAKNGHLCTGSSTTTSPPARPATKPWMCIWRGLPRAGSNYAIRPRRRRAGGKMCRQRLAPRALEPRQCVVGPYHQHRVPVDQKIGRTPGELALTHYASLAASRPHAHDSGSVWLATPMAHLVHQFGGLRNFTGAEHCVDHQATNVKLTHVCSIRRRINKRDRE